MNKLSLPVSCLLAVTAAYGVTTPSHAEAPNDTAPTVIRVTTTEDGAAVNPADSQCRTATGECTLRAATQVADARPGSTIVVPSGRYVLTIPPNPAYVQGRNPDPASGDLNLTAPTTIEGAGRGLTIIDGNHLDRVFATSSTVTISGLTVTGGVAAQHEIPYYDTGGGGIANQGALTLRGVHVTGNSAGYGGGIFNVPRSDLRMIDSVISDNHSEEAGGVRCDQSCTFTRTTIANNYAVSLGKWYRPGGFAGRGGGIDIRGLSPVALIDSVVEGNNASDGGGGINIAPAYLDTLPEQVTTAVNPQWGQLTLQGSRIIGNTVGNSVQNCKAVFARISSAGGNISDDTTCATAAVGDRVQPSA
ncbi:hypothetical protein [Nocardia xishanensis]|uniref:CSLREA domain-containing protein n=1 Tax=Nocardia xishanensis TaxID=238964 RepID=A0ABW7X6H2_9NOCA